MNGVCAVIVTYGNRWCYLHKVIDAALREGVNKVIVIDNNSDAKSRENLLRIEQTRPQKLKVTYLDKNYGSAGGFRRGLEIAYSDAECKFVWLLDDDNEPSSGSLRALQEKWLQHRKSEAGDSFALLALRKGLFNINQNRPDAIANSGIGRKGSFIYFDITEFPSKIVRYIRRIYQSNLSSFDKYASYNYFKDNKSLIDIKLKVAPYGGLFIEKSVLQKIGFPKDEFFAYADDFEWSWRLTANNGNIYLVQESQIDDIDVSWNINKKSVFHAIRVASDFRIYYFLRNRVYFEKIIQNIYSKKYKINKIIFIIILRLVVSKKRFQLAQKAIRDGENRKLGFVEDFMLE